MLIDRYPPEDVFARVPELAEQIDPVLLQLDRLLDDDRLYQQVRADFMRRYRLTAVHGRHSTPAEVLLRLLVVKHLYAWSFEETEQRVADSLVLRWFTRVYFRRVPDDTTLLRWAHTIHPETLHGLTARAAQLAAQARVTRARKLRVDGTVVETTIHSPTDSRLLGDGVRVLTRLVQRVKPLVAERLAGVRDIFRRRTRSMQRARASALPAGASPQRSGGPSGCRATSPALHPPDPDHRADPPTSPPGPPGSDAGGRISGVTPEPSGRTGTARCRAGSFSPTG
jgi:IS5 family transposase